MKYITNNMLGDDAIIKLLADACGVDYNKLVDDLTKYNEQHENKPSNNKETLSNNTVDKKSDFKMSEKQLCKFIDAYCSLENKFLKLKRLFGIEFNGTDGNIYSMYNEIVWNLIAILFGENNRDEIADFCFGSSKYNNVHDLYTNLI